MTPGLRSRHLNHTATIPNHFLACINNLFTIIMTCIYMIYYSKTVYWPCTYVCMCEQICKMAILVEGVWIKNKHFFLPSLWLYFLLKLKPKTKKKREMTNFFLSVYFFPHFSSFVYWCFFFYLFYLLLLFHFFLFVVSIFKLFLLDFCLWMLLFFSVLFLKADFLIKISKIFHYKLQSAESLMYKHRKKVWLKIDFQEKICHSLNLLKPNIMRLLDPQPGSFHPRIYM